VRTIEIDLAGGGDNTVDPRVAPQGTIARAQNVRLDRKGRLVARSGYTALGTSVQSDPVPAGAQVLVPYDLHNVDGSLVALGSHGPSQVGIHYPYRFVNNASQGIWRTEPMTFVGTAGAPVYALPAADNVAVVLSETNNVETDVNVADVAVTADGAYAAMMSVDRTFAGVQSARITVIECATDLVVYSGTYDFGAASEANPRLLAASTGRAFYLFTQVITSTAIAVRTLDMALASPNHFILSTTIATGTSAFPCPYDVAPFTGTSDYLLVFATATGYTWRRFSATHVQQTTTNVAETANSAVSICGATGETVSVLSVKSGPVGVNVRTFTTAGALSVGPTNVDSLGAASVTWVSIVRDSSTAVICRWQYTFAGFGIEFHNMAKVTTAAHIVQQLGTRASRGTSKLLYMDGLHLALETPDQNGAQRPYSIGNFHVGGGSDFENVTHGTLLNGIAKISYSAATAWAQSALVQRFGTKEVYGAVVTKDPRDTTYRAHMVRFEINSGKRRQGTTIQGILYMTGGNAALFDGRTTGELGVDIAPAIYNVTPQTGGGGAKTLLGTYTFHVIFRYVLANGEVTQSAPSDPKTLTLAGANNQWLFNVSSPGGLRLRGCNADGAQVFVDVYCTEAGGSIPRLSQSKPIKVALNMYAVVSVTETNADTVVQAGTPMYTQGSDGSVSGRLPLSLASPGRFIMESGGRLHIGGLERQAQMHISIEKRPGETQGFVNDDLFFVSNVQKLTAIAASADGRRYLFGGSTVRELVGEAPNAAGSDATLIEPVLVEPSIGCCDWRSVAVTELGIFFQSSQAPDPKLYVLPSGGGSALLASEGIRDTLRAFPVITSATRHEQEQLLTFTLQNSAGTDGRIVHLDLTNSGIGQGGFIGKWFVDRVPQLEGAPDIEIVEEYFHTFPDALNLTPFTIPLPSGKRLGDRVLLIVSMSGSGNGGISVPSNFTQLATVAGGSLTEDRITVFEMLVNSSTRVALSTAAVQTSPRYSVISRVMLLRNTHASQASEVASVSGTSTSSLVLGVLTPTWGTARNLYVTSALGAPASAAGTTVWRTLPTGFSRYANANGGQPSFGQEHATASRLLDGTSQPSVTWGTQNTVSGAAVMIAVRPLASVGTPVRASTHFGGRLVVCNTTDVVKSDSTAVADFGSAFIAPEIELADLYPMGAGGAGRHSAITFVGELLGYCFLHCSVSYDEGRNWTALRTFSLHARWGYSVGQTLRLTWVPKRRKINGVRVRLSVSENTTDLPLAGDTAGVAMQRIYMQFDELVGPSRLEIGKRQ
jgi:hypothetical protein